MLIFHLNERTHLLLYLLKMIDKTMKLSIKIIFSKFLDVARVTTAKVDTCVEGSHRI